MNESNLIHLELQVDTLIDVKMRLKEQNLSLRQRVSKLVQERAALLEQNKQASDKVKRIVARLKEDTQ